MSGIDTCDEEEKQFLRDLEVAKSLSLTCLAEKEKGNSGTSINQSLKNIAFVHPLKGKRSNMAEAAERPGSPSVDPFTVEVRARPRPSPVFTPRPQTIGDRKLLPPPLSMRDEGPSTSRLSDLIHLSSPGEPEAKSQILEVFERYSLPVPVQHPLKTPLREALSIFNERPFVLQLQQHHFTPTAIDSSRTVVLQQRHFSMQSPQLVSQASEVGASGGEFEKRLLQRTVVDEKLSQESQNWGSLDLIRLDVPSTSAKDSNRNSLWEIFDPLYENNGGLYSSPVDAVQPEDSPYDVNDPFEYMYIEKKTSERCPSIYESLTIEKRLSVNCDLYTLPQKMDTPPKRPPNPIASISAPVLPKQDNGAHRIRIEPSPAGSRNGELKSFVIMVNDLRSTFIAEDTCTNPGLVISPTIESSYLHSTSLKLIVSVPSRSNPVLFTCAGNSSIPHIITYLLCEMLAESPSSVKGMDPDSPTLPLSDFVLKVWGMSEFFTADSCLQDYEYVRQCMNTDEDVKLVLMHVDDLERKFARVEADDSCDCDVQVGDVLPHDAAFKVSYEDILFVAETIHQEADKLLASASPLPMKLTQSVKAMCSFLLGLETADVTEAVRELNSTCYLLSKEPLTSGTSIICEDGPYSIVALQGQRSSSGQYRLHTAVSTVLKAVDSFLDCFSKSFDVSFKTSGSMSGQTSRSVLDVVDTVMGHAVAIHKLDQRWSYDNYILKLELYHGTSPMSHPICSKQVQTEKVLFGKLSFDEWMDVSVSYCMLPRESRLVFVLIGKKIVTDEQKGSGSSKVEKDWIEEEIGWTAVQCFDSNWELRQGKFLLPMWPMASDRQVGPAPPLGVHPSGDYFTVLELELPDWSATISFPEVIPTEIEAKDFGLLDVDAQLQLMDTIQSCSFARLPTVEREILWEKRHYLTKEPRALPKVLLSVRSWDYENLCEIYGMLKTWRPLSPVDAIQLLLPCFPDIELRRAAVSWLMGISSDELIDLLPQIIQALKFEAVEVSPLARFLLERALTSPRVAHSLYWLLVQELPGDMPFNSDLNSENEVHLGFQSRHFRRYQVLLRVLFTICGSALRSSFVAQQLLVKNLTDVAKLVKSAKDSGRAAVLHRELDPIHYYLAERPSSLPLSLGHEVCGLDLATSSYFTSFTVPLKLVFKTSEMDESGFAAIFKVGDDLRQDMITLQMIRLMDKIWLREGLDLKMVVFKCVATGHRRGMIEIVSEAETLRKIQADHGGLTGPFKERSIQQWLMKRNPDTLDYQKALYNFTASCAGYSVATYILGICDRHNDNIMIRSSGHLFHIDFGKFLGDSQMFGSFKRDRTPFVLTSDMAYVINGGDKPSPRFQQFIDLCCQAFNAVRKHSLLFLNLFALMASSGIPGVTIDAVNYISGVLMPDLTDAEASSVFAKMIRDSLKSWFTPVNFFIHSLGQLRFSDAGEEGALLSFIPKNYSRVTDGKLRSYEVIHHQKRYAPDKYYLYVIRVERCDQREPTYLFRSYEEFCEFQHKLCLMFPLAKLPSLPRGVYLGRSSVKAVADKRSNDLEKFLKLLMHLAPEISHSSIVYTFFHPILRDQEEASITALKYKEPKDEFLPSRTLRGDIRLSLYYGRGELRVMVMHVRDLNGVGNQQETPPSSYVKVYLLPDSQKHTKRKTKVVKRNANPTFMEMLIYRLPIEVVVNKTLQASVWNHDRVTENEFLGAANIPLDSVELSVEMSNWYQLTNSYSASRLTF